MIKELQNKWKDKSVVKQTEKQAENLCKTQTEKTKSVAKKTEKISIARCTADPEIDSVTWTKFGFFGAVLGNYGARVGLWKGPRVVQHDI